MTKLALLCLWNNRSKQVPHFSQTFYELLSHKNVNVYIHPTSKNNRYIPDYILNLPNVHVLESPINTVHGTFSLVEAMMLLLSKALEKKQNSHFQWLSESDYPLWKANDIVSYSLAQKKSWFLRLAHMDTHNESRKRYNTIKHPKFNFSDFKSGGQHGFLIRRHAKILKHSYVNFEPIFKTQEYAADEHFFTTILYKKLGTNRFNSEVRGYGNGPVFADWSRNKNKSPYEFKTLGHNDMILLLSSDSLYARKFHQESDIDVHKNRFHSRIIWHWLDPVLANPEYSITWKLGEIFKLL